MSIITRINSVHQVQEILKSRKLTALELRKELESDLGQYGRIKDENELLYTVLGSIAVKSGEFCKFRNQSVAMAKNKKIHDFAVLALQKELAKGFKLKEDGSFYEKDSKRFIDLVESIRQKFGVRGVKFYKQYGSFRFEFHNQYQSVLCGYNLSPYMSQSNVFSYIFNVEKNENMTCEYKAYTRAQLIKADKELKALTEKSQEINSKMSKLKRILES